MSCARDVLGSSFDRPLFRSIRIRTDQGGDGVMVVDSSTAKELELIADSRSGGQKKSL